MNGIGSGGTVPPAEGQDAFGTDRAATGQALFESSVDGLAVFRCVAGEEGGSRRHVIADANAAFEQLARHGLPEIAGRPVDAVFGPEDGAWLAQMLSDAVQSGRTWRCERYIHALGGHLEVSVFPVSPQASAAVFVDVTDRKHVEDALRASEQLLHMVFDTMSAGVALVGPDDSLQRANPALCRLTGYSQEELAGMTWSDIVSSDAGTGADAGVTRGVGGAAGEDAQLHMEDPRDDRCVRELRFRRKDGGSFWGLDARSVIRDAEGRRSLCINVVQDITERLQAEEARAAAAARQARALEDTVATMGRLVETRDPYTVGHQMRTATLAEALAVELHMDEQARLGLVFAARVHDIGKVAVPVEFLARQTELDDEERGLLESHVEVGYRILKDIAFDWPVADIVYQHHERLDGSGYPRGLRGAEILPEARVLAVADAVTAMASTYSPQRPAIELDRALAALTRWAGVRFDGVAVRACQRIVERGGMSVDEWEPRSGVDLRPVPTREG